MGKQLRRRSLDAVIIGGGLTGFLLGAALADAGMQAAVLSLQGRTASPITEAATLLCPPMLARIQSAYGPDTARTHIQALQEQLRALTAFPLPYVQPLSAYAFTQTEAEATALTQQRDFLSGMLLPVSSAPDAGACPFPVTSALSLAGQATVNLPMWIDALRVSIRRLGGMIYDDVRLLSLNGMEIQTAQGRFEAPRIILATDKPLGLHSRRLLALLESRVCLHAKLTASWPMSGLHIASDGGCRLLPAPDGAWALWAAGRVGSRQLAHQHRRFQDYLSSRMPDWQHDGIQHTVQTFSTDGLPFIGTLPGTQYLFACGYGGCPVLGAMHAADVLTRRLTGRLRPEDRLYAPDRAIPGMLVKRSVRRNVFRYGTGMLRLNAPACAHCGCRMRYFPPGQSWGCPWCGSEFSFIGQPVSGPAIHSAGVSIGHFRPDRERRSPF